MKIPNSKRETQNAKSHDFQLSTFNFQFPIPPGRILAAVSGGADSVALLCLLTSHSLPGRLTVPESGTVSRPGEQTNIIVAHFNHRIRPAEESDADEAFVREQAAALGLPFVSGSADIPAVAASTGESLEMAARRLRHEFFQTAARENGCVAIATGHTADDQLETFFLRLARGSSLRGLCGMGHKNSPPAEGCPKGGVVVIRPLLKLRHSELVACLKSNNIPWREDATNASTVHQRNRVRKILLPAFEKTFGKTAFASALRAMESLREDNGYLEKVAAASVPLNQTLDIRALAALPPPLFNRVAADFLYSLPVEPELINAKTLARFRGMVETPPRGKKLMPVAQGWHLEFSREGVKIREPGGVKPHSKTHPFPHPSRR